ncbi:hypothetical protein BH11ARM2_BH11ARM2_29050 [soil metagenome]
MVHRIVATGIAMLVASFASAVNIYFIPAFSPVASDDLAAVKALEKSGHHVTLGVQANQLSGFALPNGTQVVFLRQNRENSYILSETGQDVMLKFVARGGGLILSMDSSTTHLATDFPTLAPAFPFTQVDEYHTGDYVLHQETADKVLNKYLDATFGIPSNANNRIGAGDFTPKTDAKVFYTQIFGFKTIKRSVVGWDYLKGRVIALPFSQYENFSAQESSEEVQTLRSNAVTWAAGSKQ